LLFASILTLPVASITAQQGQATTSVLEAKTPIIALTKYSDDDFAAFAMAYANAKVDELKRSDPAVAKEWQDYFLSRASENAVPPGVIAFSSELQALGKAAATNPHIVLANITGERVMDVVFKNYQQYLQDKTKGAVESAEPVPKTVRH
jgi:hypothetical protein